VIAALVGAVATPAVPALLAVLVRAGVHLSARGHTQTGIAARIVAADLDDYTWRTQQLLAVHAHADMALAQDWRADNIALAAVYGPRPTTPRQKPGLDIIAGWWTPDAPVVPMFGRPPATTPIGVAA
jgi:hypothetical protein